MQPRWKRCVQLVDHTLGEALGQVFVEKTFTPETKARTLAMTKEIEAAMQSEIDALPWMSPATKKQALLKLHGVVNKIGYPDKWRDYSSVDIKPDDFLGDVDRAVAFESHRDLDKIGKPVDRTEWDISPPTVNAYYDPQMNDINFPAGVLQPPLFDPKMDDAPNYGNTGATIGHELTHGFDDEGRQFDAKGNLRDWWTTADAAEFQKRADCVSDEYSQFTVVDDIKINGKLTDGRGRRRSRRHSAGLHRVEGRQQGEGAAADRRLHARSAILHRHGAMGLRQRAAGEPARECALPIRIRRTNTGSMASFRICRNSRRRSPARLGQPMVREKACKVW